VQLLLNASIGRWFVTRAAKPWQVAVEAVDGLVSGESDGPALSGVAPAHGRHPIPEWVY
jgi:hypothetical protein